MSKTKTPKKRSALRPRLVFLKHHLQLQGKANGVWFLPNWLFRDTSKNTHRGPHRRKCYAPVLAEESRGRWQSLPRQSNAVKPRGHAEGVTETFLKNQPGCCLAPRAARRERIVGATAGGAAVAAAGDLHVLICFL